MRKSKKKLLVEGVDDQHVIWALCQKYHIPETFEVIDCKGINNLEAQIPLRFKESGVDTVGVIIDADTNLNVRWESIKRILTGQGFFIPEVIPTAGLIVTDADNRKAGVWIMPDNNSNLEDFISFLVPDGDPLLPIAHSTLDLIESKNLNRYSGLHRSKAVIHSWLAWQENPGVPMGLSITKRYLSTDMPICSDSLKWLTELFEAGIR